MGSNSEHPPLLEPGDADGSTSSPPVHMEPNSEFCLVHTNGAGEDFPPGPQHVLGQCKCKLCQSHQVSDVDCLRTLAASNIRPPICCIVGDFEFGTTKLLDWVLGTTVPKRIVRGVTHKIGATYVSLKDRMMELNCELVESDVPDLWVIDTPGHESFTFLQYQALGLCDIAIVVLRFLGAASGFCPKTIGILKFLQARNIRFIVALTKVQVFFRRMRCQEPSIRKNLDQEGELDQLDFGMRLYEAIANFKLLGLDAELYPENVGVGGTTRMVPMCLISDDGGFEDLFKLLVRVAQKPIVDKVTFQTTVKCIVLEAEVVEGHGAIIDVFLADGVLNKGDQIVVCGMQGPIVTNIQALLVPQTECQLKETYMRHREIKAPQYIKIIAQGLERAVTGTELYVVGPNDDVEDIRVAVMKGLRSPVNRIDSTVEGIYVHTSSSAGLLDALLDFLASSVNLPVRDVVIGSVHTIDVQRAASTLARKKEYAVIVAFEVMVMPEAQELADKLGVKIFSAGYISDLFEQLYRYNAELRKKKIKASIGDAVFPCLLEAHDVVENICNEHIDLGMKVVRGIAKVGTPLCIRSFDPPEVTYIGQIASIEIDEKPVDSAGKGKTAYIKVRRASEFQGTVKVNDILVSRITRKSFDALKYNYIAEMSRDDMGLVTKLKYIFGVE